MHVVAELTFSILPRLSIVARFLVARNFMFSDKQPEKGQLHTRWRINLRTVLIKKHMGFTVTASILRAQYELLTL